MWLGVFVESTACLLAKNMVKVLACVFLLIAVCSCVELPLGLRYVTADIAREV